jgi:peptide/nickel transport system permease protein
MASTSAVPVARPALTRTSAQAAGARVPAWRRLRRHRLALVGGVGLGLLSVIALVGPLATPYGFEKMNLDSIHQAPSLAHPFGTDDLGRDLLTRIMYGARISLSVGLFSAAISTGIGTLVGALAGYCGSWVDTVLMRLVDLVLSIPLLPMVIVISALAKPSVPLLVVLIGLFSWMTTARLVRGSLLTLKEQEFALAARVVGIPPARIVVRHLLPNAAAPVIVAATLSVGSAIILESILSFFGLGIQPPVPSWGNMLQNAQSTMGTKPWLAIFPGVCIFLSVMFVNFLGDGLRDALDPRIQT